MCMSFPFPSGREASAPTASGERCFAEMKAEDAYVLEKRLAVVFYRPSEGTVFWEGRTAETLGRVSSEFCKNIQREVDFPRSVMDPMVCFFGAPQCCGRILLGNVII